jgi:hypothetical protein
MAIAPVSRLLALAAIGCTLLPAAELEASYLYSAPTSSDPGNEIVEHESAARASFDVVPFGSSGTWGLSAGGSFRLNAWDFDESEVRDVELYKIAASIKATMFSNPNFGCIVTLEPGLHTDFDQVGSEDLRLEGSALGVWVASPKLQVIAGLAYSDELGKAQVIPVAGVIWQATERLHVEAVFPSLTTTYAVAEEWRARAAVMAAGGQWSWTYSQPTQDVEIDAQLKAWRAETGIDRMVATDCWLTLKVGYEFARELTLERADGVGTEATLDLVDSAYGAIAFTGKL